MKKLSVLLLLVALGARADGATCDLDAPLLVVGDSLSAAYGLELDEGWVALLQAHFADHGRTIAVINASVSGDTTAGGVARLSKALPKHSPAVVVIELGGNDGLRGLPLREMRRNLERMIVASHEAGAEVVLLGMRIPSNYGPRYAQQFHAVYATLAEKHAVALVDFFLDGVALDRGLMQADGIHPNAAAQQRLLANALPAIKAATSQACAARD